MPGKQLGRVYVKDVDEVQCPICKNWYKSIAGQHLRVKHNMTIEEFKEEYPLYQYMSMDLLKKHSEIAIKNKIFLSKEFLKQQGKRGGHKWTKEQKERKQRRNKSYLEEGYNYGKKTSAPYGDRRIEKICKQCKKEFIITKYILEKNNTRFCSNSCAAKYRMKTDLGWKEYLAKKRGANLERIKKFCPICNKEFTTSHSVNSKYCSKECWLKSDYNSSGSRPTRRTGKKVKCTGCGELTYKIKTHIKKYDHHFCSIKCKSKWKNSKKGKKFIKNKQNEYWKKYRKGLVPKHKGRIISEEERKKISLRFKGKKKSREHIEKVRQTKKRLYAEGKLIPWNKGKKHSKETKRKISETRKKRIKEGKIIPWNKGIKGGKQ